jgi:hypothetical protein
MAGLAHPAPGNENNDVKDEPQNPTEDPAEPSAEAPLETTPGVGADEAPEPLDAPAVPFLGRRSSGRPLVESLFVRLIATSGVVGLAVAVAAILGTQSVSAWIIGLVASLMSVVLAGILWSSRTL